MCSEITWPAILPPIIAIVIPAPFEGKTIPAESPTNTYWPLTNFLMVPDIGNEPAPLNVESPSYLSMKSAANRFRDFHFEKFFCIPSPIFAPEDLGNIQA